MTPNPSPPPDEAPTPADDPAGARPAPNRIAGPDEPADPVEGPRSPALDPTNEPNAAPPAPAGAAESGDPFANLDAIAKTITFDELAEIDEASITRDPGGFAADPVAVSAPVDATNEPNLAASSALAEAVDRLGRELGGRLDALAGRFDREVRAEATREKVVDRLHAELQEYKQDLLLATLRPIFVDLIALHDDVAKFGGDAPMVASVQQAIEDILYRQGVEPFTEPGDQFDPRRQRAATTTPTDRPELAKTVAGRLRKGFQAGSKVIRPEFVSVHVHRPAPPEARP